MHPYTTDSEDRKRIPLWLAFLSLIAAWGLHVFLLTTNLSIPWLLDVPSFAGFYYLFHTLFDKWLWHLPILKKLGIVNTPYIAGEWKGYLTSSFDNHDIKIKAILKMQQTWTELIINLETEKSVSRSETASIITKIPNSVAISYEYINEPRAHAVETMHVHRGMARHVYRENNEAETLDGEYFTGRDRGTFGSLYFKRARGEK